MEGLDRPMAKFSLIYALFALCTLSPFASSFAMTSEWMDSRHAHSVVVDFGIEYAHPSFSPIRDVVIRNPRTTGDAAPVSGTVDQSYPDVFAQTLNAQFLLNSDSNAILQLRSFLPLNSFAQMDTGNTDLPEFVLYRAENQRPRISLLAELDVIRDLRFGLGFDLGFGVTSEATVFLQSGDGKSSSQRISATVKPKFIPIATMDWAGYRLMVKGENRVDFSFRTDSGASIFPPLNASFDVTYLSNSALYYDPWMFDISKVFDLSTLALDTWSVQLGLSFQLWSGFVSRSAVIESVSGTFSNGIGPEFKARNLLVPRIGIEKGFTSSRWSLDYAFKDSIFAQTPSGVGNYLDPPRHTASVGAVFPLRSGWEWGTSLQVARLGPQSVVKSNATEIGAPGYVASGWLYGGNIHVTIPLMKKEQD